MTEIIHDKQDQLKRIQQLLVDREALHAVYDMKGGGTGYVGITDRRLIFMDQAFVRKAKVVVSLPYNQIVAIGAEDSGKIILGSLLGSSKLIVVTGAREWSFEFRSNAKAHHAYQLIMYNLLNGSRKWQ